MSALRDGRHATICVFSGVWSRAKAGNFFYTDEEKLGDRGFGFPANLGCRVSGNGANRPSGLLLNLRAAGRGK
jgi:hypothetical protein